jgi:hypothetical protein
MDNILRTTRISHHFPAASDYDRGYADAQYNFGYKERSFNAIVKIYFYGFWIVLAVLFWTLFLINW